MLQGFHCIQKSTFIKFGPRKDRRGVDLISDAQPFGRLCYGEANSISNAIECAKFRSRSHDAVIHAFAEAGNVIETHEPASHNDVVREERCRNTRPAAHEPAAAHFGDPHPN
jgi:hypothetical protein